MSGVGKLSGDSISSKVAVSDGAPHMSQAERSNSANVAEAVFPRILPGTTGHGEKGIGEPLTVKISNAGEGRAGTLRIHTLEF